MAICYISLSRSPFAWAADAACFVVSSFPLVARAFSQCTKGAAEVQPAGIRVQFICHSYQQAVLPFAHLCIGVCLRVATHGSCMTKNHTSTARSAVVAVALRYRPTSALKRLRQQSTAQEGKAVSRKHLATTYHQAHPRMLKRLGQHLQRRKEG